MLFEINEPAFLDGTYHPASVQYPTRLNIPDERTDLISLSWLAVCEVAKKAQIALRDQKNAVIKAAGSAHRVEITRAPGSSQVAVAGGKKVADVVAVASDGAQVAVPVVDIGRNPIGA